MAGEEEQRRNDAGLDRSEVAVTGVTEGQEAIILDAWNANMDKLDFRQGGAYIAFGEGDTLAEMDQSGAKFLAELQNAAPEKRVGLLQESIENKGIELYEQREGLQKILDQMENDPNFATPNGVGFDDYKAQIEEALEIVKKGEKLHSDFTHLGDNQDENKMLEVYAQLNTKINWAEAVVNEAANPDFNDLEQTLITRTEHYQGIDIIANKDLATEGRIDELRAGAAEYNYNIEQRTNMEENISIASVAEGIKRQFQSKIENSTDLSEQDRLQREQERVLAKVENISENYAKPIDYLSQRIEAATLPRGEDLKTLIDSLNRGRDADNKLEYNATETDIKDALRVDIIDKALQHGMNTKGRGPEDFATDYLRHAQPALGMEPVNLDDRIAQVTGRDASASYAITIKKDGVYVNTQFNRATDEVGQEVKIGGAELSERIMQNGLDIDSWEYNGIMGSDTRRLFVDESLDINNNNQLVLFGDSDDLKIYARTSGGTRLERLQENAIMTRNVVSAGNMDPRINEITTERAGRLMMAARDEIDDWANRRIVEQVRETSRNLSRMDRQLAKEMGGLGASGAQQIQTMIAGFKQEQIDRLKADLETIQDAADIKHENLGKVEDNINLGRLGDLQSGLAKHDVSGPSGGRGA